MPLSSVLHFVCQTQVPAFRSFLLFLTISLLFIQFFANSTLLSLQVLKIPSFSFQELVHDKETILMSIAMSSLDYLASGQFLLRPAASSTLHFSAWGCLSPSEVLQSSFFIPSLYPILVCPGFFLLFWLQWDLSASWTELLLFTILFWKLPRSWNENSSISSRISKAWR